MNTIKFNGKNFRTRTFDVICEGASRTYTIAEEKLFFEFGENMDAWSDEANSIDQKIYFFVTDEQILFTAEKIVNDCLDVPMEFIKEVFDLDISN